jgi:hypothetical protein
MVPASHLDGATLADLAGKGEVFGCAQNTSIRIGGLSLTDFPVVGVVTIDEDTASLGDVYSWVSPRSPSAERAGLIAGACGVSRAQSVRQPMSPTVAFATPRADAKSLNTLGRTPVDVWYDQGLIQSPVFGFYLVRDEDPGESKLCRNHAERLLTHAGEVIIGDALNIDELGFPIDRQRHVTLPRMDHSSGHYSVKLDSMKVGGADVEGFWGKKVIVDTGCVSLV